MKKRALICLLALACILSALPLFTVSPGTVQAAGTLPDILLYEQYPNASEFQISTAEGLVKFSQLGQTNPFSGKTLYMICDIDMSGFSYTPPVSFAGIFDGGFHSVKCLKVTTNDANCGFIGKLTSGGVIRNLGMEGCVFTATCSKDSWRAGSIVGVMDRATVENCWSSSDVTISGGYHSLSVGGIAGGMHNGGIIKNCYFAGTATGINVAAGICGWGQGHYEGYVGQIYNCFNMGQLVATTKYPIGRYSGSILDSNKSEAMFNCFYFDSSCTGYDWSEGDTLISKSHLGNGHLAYVLDRDSALGGSPVWSQGALFPELRKTAGVYPLSVTYVAKGKSSTATLYLNEGDTYTVGVPDSISLSLSANGGTVNGRNFVMPSKAASLTVTVGAANIADYSSFPSESVYVVTNLAGFTAMATAVNGGTTFSGKSFYMLGDIDMSNTAHTPIGQFVSDSSWTKSFSGKFYGNNFKVLNLNVNNTSLNGGGLFGSCYQAYFNNLHIYNGSVTVANRAGGITGYADGCTFEYCTNGASIQSTTGKDGIGGLAGVARMSSVFNYCGNYGTVTATVSAAAGVAGWGQGNVRMTGCFNTGKISAPSDVGALARVKTDYVPEFKDCYYMKSACATSVAGKAYTEQDFRSGTIGSYINTSYRSQTSNGVYTNTPVIPAVRNQNQQPAICTRLYGYGDGTQLGYQTICANLGDDIPYTSASDYYSSLPFSAPDALTAKAYATGVPFLITYVANGGTWKGIGPNSYTRVPGVALPDETMISKDGYAFAGWFEKSDFSGQPLGVIPPETTGNKTLYAKWATPVAIGSTQEYLALVNAVNGGNSYKDTYVYLTADLDFGGQTIPALGTESAPFSGVLDGCGHTLRNLSITGNDAQGLVGCLKHGTVKFLYMESATVSGKTNTGSVVGINQEGLVLGCISSAEVRSTWTTFDYSLMSQNVRFGSDPSPNSTEERIPRMKTLLKNYAPDIIGFQEYDATWKSVVESVLTGYGSQCVFGNTTDKNAGSPLYWNSSKFTALEKGTFWLSETPETMSLGWGAAHYRTCSFAVLQAKNTDILVIAANTHLDHKVVDAQINGMKLIMDRMTALKKKYADKGYKEIYFHITGDFNVTPTNVVIQDLSTQLTEARYAAVSLGTALNQNTFSAYNASPTSIIDYMFVSNNVDVTTYKVALDKIDGNAVSDHYGIYGTLRIGGNSHGGIAGENNGVIIGCAYTGKITSGGGTAGIAAENTGRILSSYSQYTSTGTGVHANAITTKYSIGRVDHCYYASGTGLSGAGSTVTDLTASNVPGKLNQLFSHWVRNDEVNNGLPFLCRDHELSYADKGNGTHDSVCTLCGTTGTPEEHSLSYSVTVSPTIYVTGTLAGKCESCNYTETIPLPKLNGTDYTKTVLKASTCTEKGQERYVWKTTTYGSYTFNISRNPLGHNYAYEATTAPTLSAEGVLTGTCSRCSLTSTTTLPKLNATDYTKSTTKAATCTEKGTDSYKWNATAYGAFAFGAETEALGHSYTAKVTVPTCTAQGYTTHTCSRCSDTYKDSYVAAKGHTEVIDQAVEATCTESGLTEGTHCSVCSEILLAQEEIPAKGHSYLYTPVNALFHEITCEYCEFSAEIGHTYEDGFCICGEPEVKEPIEDPKLKIGHTLNLAGDISMNFAVSKSALAGFDMDTVYVESVMETYAGEGKTETTTIRLEPVDNGNYYYFTLTGLTAVQMKDRISSTLYGTKDGQPYVSPIDDYSIADYAYSQLSKAAASQSLKTLCADLLRYGTAAQIFKGYGLDNLADGDMTEEQKAYLSDIESVTFGNTNTVLNDLENAPVAWAGKSLILDSKVCLKFIFDTKAYSGEIADLTLRVSYQDMTGATKTVILKNPELYNASRGYYAFTLDTLLAAELRTVVSVQVFSGDTPVSATLQYSADTYGNNKTDTLLDLCKALFAYSDSAKAYFAG